METCQPFQPFKSFQPFRPVKPFKPFKPFNPLKSFKPFNRTIIYSEEVLDRAQSPACLPPENICLKVSAEHFQNIQVICLPLL
jgi:hypothetical protein